MAFACWSGGNIAGRDSFGFGAGEPVIGGAANGAIPVAAIHSEEIRGR
jgi:hypothetical protein